MSTKLETLKNPTTETFITNDDGSFSVTVTGWSNIEGANVMVTDRNLSVRLAAAMRWEEIDLLIAALSVARAT